MDLRQLEYFVQIANSGGFNRASAHLHLAQSALSRHIQQLEHELGVSLFERNTRGATLTDAGALLVERASTLMHQVRSLKNDLRACAAVPSGELVVGIPSIMPNAVAAALVTQLTEACPSVQIAVVTGVSGEICQGIVSGRLDLGLYGSVDQHDALKAQILLREDLLVVGAPGSPLAGRGVVTPTEVAALPLVVLGRQYLKTLYRKLGAAAPDLTKVLEVGDGPLQLEMVLSGRYCSILPRMMIQEHLNRRELCAAKLPGAFYYWKAACAPDRAGSAHVNLALRLLLRCASAHLKQPAPLPVAACQAVSARV